MKKWVWFFLAIIALLLSLIQPVLAIGLGIAVWGLYEWKVNKQLKVHSKMPPVIFIIGLAVAMIGLANMDGQEETVKTDVASEERNTEKPEDVELENHKEEKETLPEEQKVNKEDEKGTVGQDKEKLLQNLGLAAATVSRVVDGDTIELSDGSKVRLIGVNTPESTTRTEPYGKEASNYTKSKLEGKKVYLQKDVSETDRYGRLLRIVWLDIPTDLMDENEIRTKMFNADLVLNGYAEPSTYPPDVTYAEYFRKFAREAREKGTGLWSYGPEGTTKGDFDKQSGGSSTSSSGSSSGTSEQKSDRGATSGGTENFKNCTELRKVYPDGVPAGHPAYQSKFDRDHDNYACER